VMKIAATMSVLAAQRFGEEFAVQDGVGTCPIPTPASKLLMTSDLRFTDGLTSVHFSSRGEG